MTDTSRSQNDLLGNRSQSLVAWGLPAAAMVATAFIEPSVHPFVWPPALVWMGIACLANARRCGRTHCFYTGPLFLILAVVSVLHGLGILPLGPDGWRWLGIATGASVAGTWIASEGLWGKYSAASRRGSDGL